MEIKNLKLADLRLNPTNPREVVEEKYKQLIESILVFPKMLELRPVVHNARREVLGGNMRLRALQDIAQMSLEDIKARLECLEGYRSKPQAERVALLEFWQRWLDSPYAPAASAEGLTDAEQQEFIIKDNLSFGKWDWEALANDWDEEQLGEWGLDVWQPEQEEETPETKEDEFDEEQDEIHIRCKRGDIWQLGEHRLMCGDATSQDDVEKLTGGERMDLLLTDPPYGMNYQSNFRANKFEPLNNDDTILNFFPIVKNYVKGWVFVFTTWKVLNVWLPLFENYYKLTNMIVWNKGGGFIGDLEHTFGTDYELALVSNNGCKIIGKRIGSVWDISKDNVNNYLHATQKPIELFAKIINKVSKAGATVLDLFGGSGTTIIAAEQLNRKAYVMELDPHYCDVILARWEKMTGKQAIKIN